jgi:HlyD family secretion protein
MWKATLVIGFTVLVAVVVWKQLGAAGHDGIRLHAVTHGALARTVVLTGSLMPRQHAVVSPKFPSRVARVFVREGQSVTKGQALLELDAAELKLDHEKRRIEYERARLRALPRRTTAMALAKATPAAMADDNDPGAALAALDLREAALNLQRSELILRDATLRAPIDGTVIQFAAREGDMLASSRANAGDGIIIAGTQELMVRADADELDAGQIAAGMRAVVHLDAGRGQDLRAHVDSEPRLQRTRSETRQGASFDVTVLLDERPVNARVGVTATVKISTVEKSRVLLVPLEALVRLDGVDHVVTVVSERYTPVRVTVGEIDDAHAEITAGLRQGDVIALGDYASLQAKAWGAR